MIFPRYPDLHYTLERRDLRRLTVEMMVASTKIEPIARREADEQLLERARKDLVTYIDTVILGRAE